MTKTMEIVILIVSASQRELLAVFTPERSDLLFLGNIAGCRLIQYLLAGNRPDCLTAVVSTRLLLFRQKIITKLLGGIYANNPRETKIQSQRSRNNG